MISKILIGLAAIILIFVVVVAIRPDNFKVERKAAIPAPAVVVFAQVNDMHKWQSWSPWAKMDPNAKISFEGPEAGVGAAFSWAGNDKIGEGKMTILESHPNDLVRFKLEFIKPFAGTSETLFTFQPKDGQTEVTWTMTGKNNFLSKAISLFMDCDKMVGPQFEEGLANLKAQSVAAAKP
jgi:hypothetical protein